jgi:hypothetical protein
MKTILLSLCAVGLGVAQTGLGVAQEEPKRTEGKYYRLDIVVKELDGAKVINSRAHALTVEANSRNSAQVRGGSKVPMATTTVSGTGAGVSKQFNFYDIGINIDCREARELPGQLALYVNAEISSLVAAQEQGDTPPVVRQTRWSSPVVVPVKKPTTVFSSDDLAGSRKMQLEITATPIT